MNDKFEKKLKEFLIYIIIIAATFLVLPALLRLAGNNVVVNQIAFVGIFPLITFSCGAHYAYKKSVDMSFCLIAPIIFIPTMFLYGLLRGQNGFLNSLIYLVAYLICGYIGLTVGEMIAPKKSQSQKEEKPHRSDVRGNSHVRKRNVPQRVSLSHHIEDDEDNFDEIVMPQDFESSEHAHKETAKSKEDDDFEYGYDLDSILKELREKRED